MAEKRLQIRIKEILDSEPQPDGSKYLGLLATKLAERIVDKLHELHPIYVIELTGQDEKRWKVVAGRRTFQLARALDQGQKVPAIVLKDDDPELAAVDDIVSILMFSEPGEKFWANWDVRRERGELKSFGRDLDEIRHVEAILGRKRSRSTAGLSGQKRPSQGLKAANTPTDQKKPAAAPALVAGVEAPQASLGQDRPEQFAGVVGSDVGTNRPSDRPSPAVVPDPELLALMAAMMDDRVK